MITSPRSLRPIHRTRRSWALLILLGLTVSGAPVEAALSGVLEHDGRSELTLSLEIEAGGTTVAWLLLPAGTERVTALEARLTCAGETRALPLDRVTVGPVMTQRGRRVAPVALAPEVLPVSWAAELPAGAALRAEIRLQAIGASALPLAATELRLASPPLLVPGPPVRVGREAAAWQPNRGCYLILAVDELLAELAPLVAWKTACGYDVRLHAVSEIGTSREGIRAFLVSAYETWENPPLYLLLVGDVEELPTWDVSGNVSDHPYASMDETDFLPDLYVGRLSAQHASEVAIQVAKIVAYESAPEMTGGDDWFSRAMMVAGNLNSSTPVSLCRWARQELLGSGFTQVDSVYWSEAVEHQWWNGQMPIKYFMKQGVSLINYRGWAYGDAGWQPPTFLDVDVPELENGWKLPVVFSIVCHTGNFGNPYEDCFGEVWMKAGTVEEPKGAVGFVGTGEHWSHSRWNDRMDMGIFEAICHAGMDQLGPILASAKAALIPHFPGEIWMAETIDEEESVEYYAHTYNLLGDPSLSLRTAYPCSLALEGLREEIVAGENLLTFTVRAADAGTAVDGAHTALVQNGELIGYARSATDGTVALGFTPASGDSVTLTVSGRDLTPRRVVLPVTTVEIALTATGALCNSVCALPAGPELDVVVEVENTGSEGFNSATAVVSAPGGPVRWLDDTLTFGPLGAGASGTAQDELRLEINAEAENGTRVEFLMTPMIQGAARTPTAFWMTVAAPQLTVIGVTDGADGLFRPGETCELWVALRNEGSIAGGELGARLRTTIPGGITLIDSIGMFGTISPGASGTNTTDPYWIRIAPETPPGTVVPLQLLANGSEGSQQRINFSLVVGPEDFSEPVGPDAYGYYAYDSADLDFPEQMPRYQWVECSPLFGGSGTLLEGIYDNKYSEVVTLPFPFSYYGVTYDSVRVSDNGWIAFDTASWYDIRNWSMPDPWGAACLVAAFWDNLDPDRGDDIEGSDGIYAWHDANGHRFVIEWSRLKNWEDTADDLQTFQLILLDPAHHPTASGDGEILVQYKQIVNDDAARMYATVGIEDQTEEDGLLVTYGNQYARGAAPLSPGLAIRFTTEAPVYDPLETTLFTATRGDDRSVTVSWELSDERPIRGLELRRAAPLPEASEGSPAWGCAQRVHAALLAPDCRSFQDETARAGTLWRYELHAHDAYGKVRPLGVTEPAGAVPPAPTAIELATAAVAPGAVAIRFSAGPAGVEEFAVYDAAGRRVADLRGRVGPTAAGTIVWNSGDQRGQRVPSGLYWVRLRASGETRRARVLIVR